MKPMRLLWHSRLRRDTFLLLALQTFYKLSGIMFVMVLSRRLSTGDIGVYFFAVSFAEAFAFLAGFQLNPVMMRKVAADMARASSHLAPVLGFRFFGALVYLLCVFTAAVTFAGGIWRIIMVVAIFTLVENVYFTFASLFIALGRAVYNVCIGAAVEVLFLSAFLLGMWWAPSINVLLEAGLLRSLFLVGTAVLVARHWLFPLQVSWDYRIMREGLPFILTTLIALLGDKVDTLLLGFLTGYETVGRYHLGMKVVLASLFIPTVVGQVVFPALAAAGLTANNRRTVLRGAGFLLGLGVFAMAVGFIFAFPLTAVFYGSVSATVAPLLRPLTLLFPLLFLNSFMSLILQALYQETRVLRSLAIGTGASILGNCALIPLLGVYGAVYARVLSGLVRLGILSWHLRHLFLHPPSPAARPDEEEELTIPAGSQW